MVICCQFDEKPVVYLWFCNALLHGSETAEILVQANGAAVRPSVVRGSGLTDNWIRGAANRHIIAQITP